MPEINNKDEPPTLGTRAIYRRVEPDIYPPKCAQCDERIRFKKGQSNPVGKIVCNVYKQEVKEGEGEEYKWDRVEHYHDTCYVKAGEPNGPVFGAPESVLEGIQKAVAAQQETPPAEETM